MKPQDRSVSTGLTGNHSGKWEEVKGVGRK